MNVEFIQWNCKCVSIAAIILSIISLSCVAISQLDVIKSMNKVKSLRIIWKARFGIFHGITFLLLTAYIILNWEKCISMKFFSNFDGNNVLFVAWIVLIFLNMYNIKIKDIEFIEKRADEKLKEDVQNIELNYQIQQAQQMEEMQNSIIHKNN